MRTHTHTHTHHETEEVTITTKKDKMKNPQKVESGGLDRNNGDIILVLSWAVLNSCLQPPSPGITATSLKQTTMLNDLKSLHWRTHLHAVRAVPDDAAGVLVWAEGCCSLMLVKKPVARLLLVLWYFLPGLLLGDSTVLVLFAISWVIYERGKKKSHLLTPIRKQAAGASLCLSFPHFFSSLLLFSR